MRASRCLRTALSSRQYSRDQYVKRTSERSEVAARNLDNLLDLKEVQSEWRSAGYFPKAPEHAIKHGTLKAVCVHFKLFDHVFSGHVFTPRPMHVHYGDGLVDYGNILTPLQAASPPEVEWLSEEGKLYTLLLLSPDDHPTQYKSTLLHWHVANIPQCAIRAGTTLTPYIPPVPYKNTGFHRFVFVLLEQEGVIEREAGGGTLEGRSVELCDLISRDHVTPCGVAFYQSSWDETVGRTLAVQLDCDEKQYTLDTVKDIHEHYAEEQFMVREWEMRTGFM